MTQYFSPSPTNVAPPPPPKPPTTYAELRAAADAAERAGASRREVLKMRDTAQQARIKESLRKQAEARAERAARQADSLAARAASKARYDKFEPGYDPGAPPPPPSNLNGVTILNGSPTGVNSIWNKWDLVPVDNSSTRTVSASQQLSSRQGLQEESGKYVVTNPYNEKNVNLAGAKNAREAFALAGYRPPSQVGQLNLERPKSLVVLKGEGLLPGFYLKGKGSEAAGRISVFQRTVTAQNQAEATLAGLPEPGTYNIVGDTRTYNPRESILVSANKQVSGRIEAAGKNKKVSISSISKGIEGFGKEVRLRNEATAAANPAPTGEPTSLVNRFQLGGKAIVFSSAKVAAFSGGVLETLGADIRERPVTLAAVAGSGRVFKLADETLLAARGSKVLEGAGALPTAGRSIIQGTRVGGTTVLAGGFAVGTGAEALKTGGDTQQLSKLTARTLEDVGAFTLGANPSAFARLRNPAVKTSTSGPLGDVVTRTTESRAFETTSPTLASPVAPRTTTTTTYMERFTGRLQPTDAAVKTRIMQYPTGTVRKVQQAGGLRIVTKQKAGQAFTTRQVFQDGALVDASSTQPFLFGKQPRIQFRVTEPPASPVVITLNLKVVDTRPTGPLLKATTTGPKEKPLLSWNVRQPAREPGAVLTMVTKSTPEPKVTLTLKGTNPSRAKFDLKVTDPRPKRSILTVKTTKGEPSPEVLTLHLGREKPGRSITLGAVDKTKSFQLAPDRILQVNRLEVQRQVTNDLGGKAYEGFSKTKGQTRSLSVAGNARTREFGRLAENKGRGTRIVRSEVGRTQRSTTPLTLGDMDVVRQNELSISRGAFLTGESKLTQTGEVLLSERPGKAPRAQQVVAGLTAKRSVASVVKGKTVTVTTLKPASRDFFVGVTRPGPKTLDEVRAGEPKLTTKQDIQDEAALSQLVGGKTTSITQQDAVLQEAPLAVQPLRSASQGTTRLPKLTPKTTTRRGAIQAGEPQAGRTGSGAVLTLPKNKPLPKAKERSQVSPLSKAREELGIKGATKPAVKPLVVAVQGQNSRGRTEQRSRLSQKPVAIQKLVQEQTPRQEQQFKQRQDLRIAPLRVPNLPEPGRFGNPRKEPVPKLPGLGGGSLGKGAGGFNVLVRRAGKFQQINTGLLTSDDALKLGKNKVENTLAASFKVVTPGGRSLDTGTALSALGGKYRTAKKDRTVFVQKAPFRLSTTGEKTSIKAAKKVGRLRL